MPPKRKAAAVEIAPLTSATSYTDSAGEAANKRSRVSRPTPGGSDAGKDKKKEKEGTLDKFVVKKKTTTTIGTEGDAQETDPVHDTTAPTRDDSQPEALPNVVDRRFYPAEMSNERCAAYNEGAIPRPLDVLTATLATTKSARDALKTAPAGAVLHWFKRDLRMRDNTALAAAAALAKATNVPLVCIWLCSPQDWTAHLVSAAKCDFELRSVALLQADLAALDIPLYTATVARRRDVAARVLEVARAWDVKNVFCNIEYEPDELRREEGLVRSLLDAGIAFAPLHDDCVVPPGSLTTAQGKQYAVFSPWFRAWTAHVHARPYLLTERAMPGPNPPQTRDTHAALFGTGVPDAPPGKQLSAEERVRFAALWPASEGAAMQRLERFCREKVDGYKAVRDFPAVNGTARVSVHHAAGTLAARTSVRVARGEGRRKLDAGDEGLRTWISEVAWRDFYRHVLVAWPYVCMNKPFKYEYTNLAWESNAAHLAAWRTGHTGFPLIDAAMRCLAHTAFMPNRLRMLTASFLAKHLLLDWRLGEQWFMTHLVDGDFASNNGGWGFAASVGVDPQPYFRVFNPWLQGERFDADGDFVRAWVPELSRVEGSDVLNPYAKGGKAERIAREEGYPRPIVEHRAARERCLARYKEGLGRDTA